MRNKTFKALLKLMEAEPGREWTKRELADKTGFSDIGVYKSLNNSPGVFKKLSSGKYMQPDRYSLQPDYREHVLPESTPSISAITKQKTLEDILANGLFLKIPEDTTIDRLNEYAVRTLKDPSEIEDNESDSMILKENSERLSIFAEYIKNPSKFVIEQVYEDQE